MINQSGGFPLNITLSIGDVSFHLAPSAEDQSAVGDNEWLSSPKSLASPRSASHRRRNRRRSQAQDISIRNATSSSNPEHQHPIISIRRGKPEQQQQPSTYYSSTSKTATPNNHTSMQPPSPMRQHIIGRVRKIKEKIEIEERRKSGSSYNQASELNTIKSPEPKTCQPSTQLSGYCVDLHSFTGTLNIMPNNNLTTKRCDHNGGLNGYSANTTSDYVIKSTPKAHVPSPRKRIVTKNNKHGKEMKRSKTTWIASNGSEVEMGIDQAKTSSLSDGKHFDFVDTLSESEYENIGDIESGAIGSDKAVKFSSIAANNQQPTQTVNALSKSLPHPAHVTHITESGIDHKAKTGAVQVENKARPSLSTPPKLLQYAQQAMKQIGLAGHDESYAALGSDPALRTVGSSRSCDATASAAGGHEYNDTKGTELHYACASLDVARIHRTLEYSDTNATMVVDSKGRFPIHVLAENYNLIKDNPVECEDIADIFAQLMGPDKLVQAIYGNSGWGPFVGIIGSWCDQLHSEIDQHKDQPIFSSIDRQSSSGVNPTLSRGNFTPQIPLFWAADRNNVRMLQSSQIMQDREKAFYLPKFVGINPHVKWAIQILSNLIDLYPENTREAILTNITSTVPSFLKCVFLVNDSKDLTSLTDMSLIKHAAIDKRSINVWLIAMLTSTTREIQMRAVLYLKLLSRLTLTDLNATSRYRDKFSDAEIERFVSLRTETFNALYSMPGIFPAVLGLGGRGIESLSTARVMGYITYRTIRKEKQFFRLICDFFYGIFLLLGFRLQVEFVFTDDHRDGPSDGYRQKNFWSMSTWALAFYFLVKDLITLLSLYATSTELAKRYCSSVFNIIDMGAVLLLVCEGGPVSDENISMSDGWIACLVTILLWLRLMGAFKILNPSFALFLYAVNEVVKEIKWFIVFLFMVTCMFSDAARAAVVITNDCDSQEYADKDFCKGGYNTIVRMYAILVGDVDLDYFGNSSLLLAVFFFFSFFCIVLLLNILIAIVDDSYNRTKTRAIEIFGRAQVEYAAALVARNQFIRPRENSQFHVASFVPLVVRRFLRLVYILAHIGALLQFQYAFVGAITYWKRTGSDDSELIENMMVMYIILGSVFNTYIFVFGVITLMNWLEQINPDVGQKLVTLKRALLVLIKSFHRVLGFTSNQSQFDLSEDVIEG